jgi:GGDEF domain-containing protein
VGTNPFRAEGSLFGVTCSLGFAWRAEASPEDAGGLIHEADIALYQAKARGRNRVEGYVQDLQMVGEPQAAR